jgi:hypothetical protein
MRKKIVLYCFFVMLLLECLPVVSSEHFVTEQQDPMLFTDDSVSPDVVRTPNPAEITGYLLIHVAVYTPGEGLQPYVGANISVNGLFYKYSGQTDEQGDCLFQVHSRLLRAKLYFIKVSIPPDDWLHTKINTFYIQSRQIVYRNYLFIEL